jgi:hypothetical protein
MLYKFSTPGHSLILTLIPDMSINTGNIYRTESLLEHAVSSPISCIVFNLESLSSLNAVGRWTIYQVTYQAKKKGNSYCCVMFQPRWNECSLRREF